MEEGGARQLSAYCKEDLMRGGTELSFEELRAHRFKQRRLQLLEEKLKLQSEVKQKLSQELEFKKKLLELGTSQVQQDSQISSSAPAAASFHIYDEGPSDAARPSGNLCPEELQDDVFLRPGERGPGLQVQGPPPGGVSQVGPQAEGEVLSSTEDLQTGSQRPASKTKRYLSPIQEASVEANAQSAGVCSQDQNQEDQDQEDQNQEGQDQEDQNPEGQEDQDQEDQDQEDQNPEDQDQGNQNQEDQEDMDLEQQEPGPVEDASLDPCDPDLRRRLLDLRDVTSSPDFHSESRPLPTVEQDDCLQLGDTTYLVCSRLVDAGLFCVFEGVSDDSGVLLKVDRRPVPWDFHLSLRLRDASPDSLPHTSCFLFLDGCITVFTTPPGHKFTRVSECVLSEVCVCFKVVALLQLVLRLHSCRLLHAALTPQLLACCSRGALTPDAVFPVDWSSSLDLDLQTEVRRAQQVPSARRYISLGLLEPAAPPQQVDLLGLAETVHVLLTNAAMVPVRDEGGWTAEAFRGDAASDAFSRTWRRFFRSCLNADGRSSTSVLTELKEQLTTLCSSSVCQ